MRETLFRGKRFDDKTWIYGSLLENDIIVVKGATAALTIISAALN